MSRPQWPDSPNSPSDDPGTVQILGIALWYAGRANEALAQYEKSLAINATHAQTLFNAGIVRADGKGDNAGAVAVWDALLKSNPQYPDITRGRRKT